MANTNELKYSKSHEWVRYEGDEAYIGITDFAQSSMGDLVFVNLPEVDDEIEVGWMHRKQLTSIRMTHGSFALETSQRPKSCWMRKRTISLLKKKKRKKSL